MRKTSRITASGVLAAGLLLTASPVFAGAAPGPTTTTLTTNKSTLTTGETVTLTAEVTSPQSQICAGNITIQPHPTPSVVACTSALTGGASSSTAICSVTGSSLGTGVHNLRATYTGNYFCQSSQSADLSVTVVNTAAVPTTSEWTLWGMVAVFLIGGGALISRRFRAA